MTPTNQLPAPIDRATFATLLDRLVSEARARGVPLAGAYDLRTPHRDRPDYTVEITRIEEK